MFGRIPNLRPLAVCIVVQHGRYFDGRGAVRLLVSCLPAYAGLALHCVDVNYAAIVRRRP